MPSTPTVGRYRRRRSDTRQGIKLLRYMSVLSQTDGDGQDWQPSGDAFLDIAQHALLVLCV